MAISNFPYKIITRKKGLSEKAQSIDNFLNTPVFEWSDISIRNMLKFIADKLICHVDAISYAELAMANFYMSHLSNPYCKNNLHSIMQELNDLMK